jgi:hypothetical protein
VLTPEELRDRARAFLAEHDPHDTHRQDFLNARFDAGLAWVNYPEGLGGLGLSRSLQQIVDAEFAAAGSPGNNASRNAIGLGNAAPTIAAYGTDEQRRRWLRELWTGREIWCQLLHTAARSRSPVRTRTATPTGVNQIFRSPIVSARACYRPAAGQRSALAGVSSNTGWRLASAVKASTGESSLAWKERRAAGARRTYRLRTGAASAAGTSRTTYSRVSRRRVRRTRPAARALYTHETAP